MYISYLYLCNKYSLRFNLFDLFLFLFHFKKDDHFTFSNSLISNFHMVHLKAHIYKSSLFFFIVSVKSKLAKEIKTNKVDNSEKK